MNKDMNVELERLVKKYDLEELVQLYDILGDDITARLNKMIKIMGGNNVVVPTVTSTVQVTNPVTPVIETPAEAPTVNNAVEFVNNCTTEELKKKKGNDTWDTKNMPQVCHFDKDTKKYIVHKTNEKGVLRTVVNKKKLNVVGGQYAKDGRIYNFIYNPQYNLPIFFGPTTEEFLKELGEKVSAKLPSGYVAADKFPTAKKSDYGYAGRFYYDELEKGTFIYKRFNGYYGFHDGMAFNVTTSINKQLRKEVIDSIHILNYNYYFSSNYENAYAPRMRKMYPNMISDIEKLMVKVNDRFNGVTSSPVSNDSTPSPVSSNNPRVDIPIEEDAVYRVLMPLMNQTDSEDVDIDDLEG